MNDHKFPGWFKTYADWFVPRNRCTYCWWVRGGIAHAVAWDILVSMLLEPFFPALAWFLRGAAVAAIVVLQITDNYNKELNNASRAQSGGLSSTGSEVHDSSGSS